MTSPIRITEFVSAFGAFSNPRASANPDKLSSAILELLSASSSPMLKRLLASPIRTFWFTVIPLAIVKFTLLQQVLYDNDDPQISTALQDHFTNLRCWLTITPEIQSPLYPSGPNHRPNLLFYSGIALSWWRNHPVIVYRDGRLGDHYWFYCFWPSTEPILSWLRSIRPDRGEVYHYRMGRDERNKEPKWVPCKVSVRPLETIHCEAKQEIMAKLEHYQSTHSRQNWVFEGPPGVGKTSTACALAAKLKQPLFPFPLMNTQMDDILFRSWLEMIPEDAVVLFDDTKFPFPQKLSLACMYDFLDGTMAAKFPHRLVIVITNSKDFVKNLPGELNRSGRLSETVYFSWATPSDAEAMFMQEYQESLPGEGKLQDLASSFGAHLEGKEISHAAIEQHLRRYTATEAVEYALALAPAPAPATALTPTTAPAQRGTYQYRGAAL